MPVKPEEQPGGDLYRLLLKMPDMTASFRYPDPMDPEAKAAANLASILTSRQAARREVRVPDVKVEVAAPKVTVTTAIPAWLGWILALQGAGILGLLTYMATKAS